MVAVGFRLDADVPDTYARRRPLIGPSNFVAQGENCFQRLDHGSTVVLLLGLWELIVRNEVRVVFDLIIPHGAAGPAVVDPLQRPVVVVTLGKMLNEAIEGRVQLDAGRVNRLRLVRSHEILLTLDDRRLEH